MNYIGKLVNNVRDFYNEINSSTLSGALDVIVIEQPDGSLKSSPFYVKFGKLGVLRSKEKMVDVAVNGKQLGILMKLSQNGDAYFMSNELCSCSNCLKRHLHNERSVAGSDGVQSDDPDTLIRHNAKSLGNLHSNYPLSDGGEILPTSFSEENTDIIEEFKRDYKTQITKREQNELFNNRTSSVFDENYNSIEISLSGGFKSTKSMPFKFNELIVEKYHFQQNFMEIIKDKNLVVGLEDESQRAKQQALSLRRENGTLDTECHERERQVNQLQTRVAVLEQEMKDKEQLVLRTKEVLEATQQQKNSVEGNAESKQLQIGKLEATVKSLSEELIKANGIIKKLQGELRGLVGKIKVKNTVMVSQEKVLQETQERLHNAQRDLQDTQQQLKHRDEEVSKLKKQLEETVQKLDESREVLKTNENVIMWLNKQLNENQLSRKPETLGKFETPSVLSASAGQRMGSASHNMLDSRACPSSAGQGYPITSTLNSKLPLSSRSVFSLHNQGPGAKVQFNPMSTKPGMSPLDVRDGSPTVQHPLQPSNKENGEPAGLESKYFEKRDDSIPLRGLLSGMHLNRDVPRPPPAKPGLHSLSSAYFPG